MRKLLTRLLCEESGQDLVEYALLAGFISVATIGAMQLIASYLANRYNSVETTLQNAP